MARTIRKSKLLGESPRRLPFVLIHYVMNQTRKLLFRAGYGRGLQLLQDFTQEI